MLKYITAITSAGIRMINVNLNIKKPSAMTSCIEHVTIAGSLCQIVGRNPIIIPVAQHKLISFATFLLVVEALSGKLIDCKQNNVRRD